MRITHVTDCYLPRVGGIERQIHGLAVRQQRNGHDVQIVTSVAGTTSELDERLTVRRPRSRPGHDPGTIHYEWSARGRRLVIDSGADVVHVHASTMSPLALATVAATARLGIPTVVTVHSLWAYAAPLYRWADRTVRWRDWPITWSAVSSVAAQPLQRILGPTIPVTVLPNGVDADAWRVPSDPRSADRIVIASVGRLAHRKRIRPLLRMLRSARAAIPADIQMDAVIAGDGPQAAPLRRYLARHDMTPWVRLIGAVRPDQIRQVHARSDFYVAPALLESFGIAALEARCAGLPVIAFGGTGIADFILHDVEGLLVVDDTEMTDRIIELATSSTTLDRMRRHNAATLPPIGWADTMRLSEALYQQALGGTLAHPTEAAERSAIG